MKSCVFTQHMIHAGIPVMKGDPESEIGKAHMNHVLSFSLQAKVGQISMSIKFVLRFAFFVFRFAFCVIFGQAP